MFMNMYVHGYAYVYDSICWALKCPVHCAEQFLELKICISPQFRAIDPPNPARGFIQQNENVRFATAACMQKYGNVSFATVACAKCMRYGGRGGGTHTMGGGGWQHGTRHHIFVSFQGGNRCHDFQLRIQKKCHGVFWMEKKSEAKPSKHGQGAETFIHQSSILRSWKKKPATQKEAEKLQVSTGFLKSNDTDDSTIRDSTKLVGWFFRRIKKRWRLLLRQRASF